MGLGLGLLLQLQGAAVGLGSCWAAALSRPHARPALPGAFRPLRPHLPTRVVFAWPPACLPVCVRVQVSRTT